jgi:hypothetical protein
MQLHWRRHLLVLALVAATWVPAWLLDHLLLGPGAGGWISIDFRGFLVVPYVLATLLFAVITTSIVASCRPERPGAVRIYVGIAVAIILACILSFAVWLGS